MIIDVLENISRKRNIFVIVWEYWYSFIYEWIVSIERFWALAATYYRQGKIEKYLDKNIEIYKGKRVRKSSYLFRYAVTEADWLLTFLGSKILCSEKNKLKKDYREEFSIDIKTWIIENVYSYSEFNKII